jgi:C4-dicarboxylate-specific signal transduction histidine kinase
LRRRSEQALRHSEALSGAVLASLQGLVAVIDRSGMIIAVNEEWSRFAGEYQPCAAANACVGANYLDICRRAVQANDLTAAEVLGGIESVLSGAEPKFSHEYRCPPPGQEVWYMMTVEPLRRPAGGAVILHLDITERKHAEMAVQRHQQELAHVARTAMMGELTASLAHELNHPLGAILSNAQAAQRFMSAEPPDLTEVREILADIIADDQRAVEVIRRLRRFLTRGDVEFLPLRVNDVIREVVRLLHSDALMRHVTIVPELDPDLPPVRGDRVQLQQVLLNLMLNGFEAMAAQTVVDRRLAVQSHLAGPQHVQVDVRDRGSGFDADQSERLFEPFYTTKVGGMGMGLAISRSIVEMHGGRLWAANNPDRGTTFSFTLPVSAEES